jgi:hypothetical protein
MKETHAKLVFVHVFDLEVVMPLVIRLDAELESGLRALSAEEHAPQAEVVRRLIRERLQQRKKKKTAFEVAQEMGVIGIDGDSRRDVAKRHSQYVKQALRGKRTA